jgi:hypothetical protein
VEEKKANPACVIDKVTRAGIGKSTFCVLEKDIVEKKPTLSYPAQVACM